MAYNISKREAKLTGVARVKSEKSSDVNKLAKAQRLYEKSLKPSGEERAAEQTLNNLIQSEELGVREIQKQAIPLTFIQGQSERLRDQATAQAVPLKLKLATLQARREAATKVAANKVQNYSKSATTKTTDPLDTEYKQLRNDRAKLALAKAQVSKGKKESDGWGAWTTKDVKDASDPLGRRKKTVSVRINKKTGEREIKD